MGPLNPVLLQISVSNAIWKRFSKTTRFMNDSKGRVQFEVSIFEKLTSVYFFKLHKKTYISYY